MKKLLFSAAIIAMVVVSIVLTVFSLMPPKKIPLYSDEKLRELALSKGLKSVPDTFEELLSLTDDAKNPMTHAKIALGEELFFDINLSKNRKTSCATCHSFDRNLKNRGVLLSTLNKKEGEITNCAACHLQDQSGVDRFTFAQGDGDRAHPHLLNTQSILNASLAKYFTWSGEIGSLREQSKNSLQAPHKMNLTPHEAEMRIKENPLYSQKFEAVFQDGVTFENITKALEVYTKTLLTRGDYDRFLDGDNSAMDEKAKRGLANFISFGCKGCHNGMSLGGQSIQEFPLREFARLNDLKLNFEFFPEFKKIDSEFPFKNSGGYLGKGSEHLFRVPILRNVTKTSPYFHNGAVSKIREAVDIMAKHQLGRHLTHEQIDEIVAFLRALEGDIVEYDMKGVQ